MVRMVTPKRSASASAVTPVRRPRRYSASAKSRSVLCIWVTPDIPLTAPLGKVVGMNADLRNHGRELEPTRLGLPQAAWARLRSHLGPPGVGPQGWGASFAYGVSPAELAELTDYWRDGFELPPRLLALPCFEAS